MDTEVRSLPHELLHLTFQVAGRMRESIERGAAELDLPPAQAQALATMHSPAPMRDLAQLLACDASNVTGIVDGLERRGLVRRQPDPRDRRVKQLVLTPEGERRRATLHANLERAAIEVFDLPEADQRTLRDLLVRLVSG